jgi:hypothetical protein
LVTQRLDPANARSGERILSDDGATRYHAERHASGGVTFHRTQRKPSKAEKKRAKKAKRDVFTCSASTPCCDRRDQYNGFASGPLLFTCPRRCACHD